MAGCCESECGLNPASDKQRQTLRIVLAVNAVMFAVIVTAAVFGNSSSLLADSLDNLGDALTYGFSLYAVSKAVTIKAKVALLKGGLILAAAVVVAVSVGYKVLYPGLPSYETMGIFSIAGLVANSICLALLWRHRSDDVNMSSVWECSRNDIASNLSVFVAAGAVWATGSAWPDMVVAAALVLLLLRSAIRVNSSAITELRIASSV